MDKIQHIQTGKSHNDLTQIEIKRKPRRQIDYLKLIGWLHRELKTPVPPQIEKSTQLELVKYTNELLKHFDCLPF